MAAQNYARGNDSCSSEVSYTNVTNVCNRCAPVPWEMTQWGHSFTFLGAEKKKTRTLALPYCRKFYIVSSCLEIFFSLGGVEI